MAGNSKFAKLFGVKLAQEFLTQNRIIFVIFLTACSVLRYDNVRGDTRGPFVSYPVLEDRPLRPSRPTNLALETHDSPLI